MFFTPQLIWDREESSMKWYMQQMLTYSIIHPSILLVLDAKLTPIL